VNNYAFYDWLVEHECNKCYRQSATLVQALTGYLHVRQNVAHGFYVYSLQFFF